MKDAGAQSIELVPLQIRKDRKHYIVEDVLQHEYYEMPKICIDAIKMLQEGKEPQEIEPLLKSRYPKEDVDMDAFMAQLWELRLLRRWNGRQQEIVQRSAKQSWGSRFSPWLKRLGSMMFHPVAIIIYISLFLYNVLQIIMTEKAPVYQDLFATDSMMVNMLSYSLLGLVAAVLHECGHTLAVAAKGLRFKWTIGHRLFIPVIETEMNEVWSLPSKSRYVPYLAGMCVDQVLLFDLLWPPIHPSSRSCGDSLVATFVTASCAFIWISTIVFYENRSLLCRRKCHWNIQSDGKCEAYAQAVIQF